tara:strand:- start:5954 stop:6655 length:702 start_codon:yes stop_codon:yes gene_type:complete
MKIRLTKKILVILGVMAVGTGSARAETGFLGLEVQGFDKKVAKILGQIDQNGVLVKNVAIGEAGAIAGFRRGDLIIEFNRQKIRNFDGLLKAVIKTKPRQKIPVTVKRNGRTVKLILQSGTRPAAWKVAKGSFANYPNIGITVAAITKKVREQFALRWDSMGVVVTLVDSKSKVVSTGLKPGDVIVQANLQEIWQPQQLTKIIRSAKNGGRSEILILIDSPNGLRYSLLPLKK